MLVPVLFVLGTGEVKGTAGYGCHHLYVPRGRSRLRRCGMDSAQDAFAGYVRSRYNHAGSAFGVTMMRLAIGQAKGGSRQ